jgi:hypothetical protein
MIKRKKLIRHMNAADLLEYTEPAVISRGSGPKSRG